MKTALERAEYSLQQGTIVIALIVGGAALAAMGTLRLRRVGFVAMPKGIAALALACGAAVAAFGVALIFLRPAPEPAAPRASLVPAQGSDQPAKTGKGVTGKVVDAHGTALGGVRVTLVPLFADAKAKSRTTRTDDAGAFSFRDVTVDPGSPYAADASYDGARFPSGVLRGPERIVIRVAKTTKLKRDLDVKVESVAVIGDPSGAQAVHAMTIENMGTKAFAGPLRLPLLPGATVIQEGAGLDRRFLRIDNSTSTPSMVSTLPILPGSHDLTYTYVVQMTKRGVSLHRTPALGTDRYELLLGGQLQARSARGLRDDGKVTLGPENDKKTYRRLIATNLRAGQNVAAQISEGSESKAFTVAVPIAAGLVVIALFVIPIVLRRRRKAEPSPQADEPASTPA